ncbi:MAG: hypothetical protein JW913_18695 [Chitinispirillaceae bacterium]|nr:hypothetical protein [Chitinispirillaceae bacterium]
MKKETKKKGPKGILMAAARKTAKTMRCGPRSNKNKWKIMSAKQQFETALRYFVESMGKSISSDDGQWTIKGFIDLFKNVYTISADTKIVSKILEIHLFPGILKFAADNSYKLVLAQHQNYYPDILAGNGMFSKLGEEWFDEYWINYRKITVKVKRGVTSKISSLSDFVKYRKGDASKIVPRKSGKKIGGNNE